MEAPGPAARAPAASTAVPNLAAPRTLAVLDDDAGVAAVLSPLRRRILRRLAGEPDSAAGLARKLEMPRQKLGYHLRELERGGFIELAEEVQRRGCVERRLRATARGWVVAPQVLGELAADPERIRDRFSSAYLLALAGRLVGEVASLRRRAAAAGKRLATFSLTADVAFRSAAERAAFAEELTEAVAGLTAKYHDDSPGSRRHRFVVAAHPAPAPGGDDAPSRDPEEN